MKAIKILYLFLLVLLISCNVKAKETSNSHSKVQQKYSSAADFPDTENTSCELEDGRYSAKVEYKNPKKRYAASYLLDVDVENCQVVQINFPNDGYLDDDQISSGTIDEKGNVKVKGKEGRTYEIKIHD